MKYKIKHIIVFNPEVDLPEGSLPVSVKHHDAFRTPDMDSSECWYVVYLEPVKEKIQQ